jgi:hypothetical protein
MRVIDLRNALLNVPDDAEVVFQANVPGEDDKPGEATYTVAYGTVFSAFHRDGGVTNASEFVIDGMVTDSEGGIL